MAAGSAADDAPGPPPDPADEVVDAELVDDDAEATLAAERAFLRSAGLGLRLLSTHIQPPPPR